MITARCSMSIISEIFTGRLSKSYDPELKYSIPYFWGTVGILYNTNMVDEEITSWDSLFNGKYARRDHYAEQYPGCLYVCIEIQRIFSEYHRS